MKTIIKLFAVLALAVATFSQHTTASAGDVFRQSGNDAIALFSSLDPSGCITTDVTVAASDIFNHNPPGPPNVFSGTFIFISQYDFCTDTLLLDASGFNLSLGDKDFQAPGNLTSARLTATINVYDFVSDSNFDVFVDLAWTATSPLSRFHENDHFVVSPHCKSFGHVIDTFRFAQASGIVSDGATNFTPEATEARGGSIGTLKTGGVDIVDICS